MEIFTAIYILFSIGVSIEQVINGSVWQGPVFAMISIIGFWAGSSTRGMLFGSHLQKLVGLVFGAVLMGIGYWLSRSALRDILLFGYRLSAAEWSQIGALVGFVVTTRDMAGDQGEAKTEAPVTISTRIPKEDVSFLVLEKQPQRLPDNTGSNSPDAQRQREKYDAAMREKRLREKYEQAMLATRERRARTESGRN